MNYVVMDDYEENVGNQAPTFKNRKINNNINIKKIFIITLIFFILILGGYFVINLFSNTSTNYKEIENQMVNQTKLYVQENNLDSVNGLYITNNQLSNIKLGNNCSDVSGVVVEGGLFYPYLVCNDYKSDIIQNKEEYAKLNGEEIVVLNTNTEYDDLGVSTSYEVELITDYVNRAGVYNYIYKIKEDGKNLETIRRKVIVINDNNQQVYPNIQLNGEEIVYLTIGSIYNDPGVIASDAKDGNITSLVKIVNNVNYNQIGEYEIKYTITNSMGYSNVATRKIIIAEKNNGIELVVNSITSPVSVTNTSVRIILMVTGDNYKHAVLPDGTINTKALFEFEASKNDIYKFMIYDNNDNMITKEIEISNIDKEIPTATCSAITFKDYTEVTIKDVSKTSCVYNYETSSYSSVYMNSLTYKMPVGELENVSVNVKDLAGNIGKVNCSVEKDLSIINKEYITDKGYHCIEPYTCLKQGDYWRTDYCYYSKDTCGPISKRGCSITSVATILSKWDKRSSNGELYTPYTLMDEVEVYRKCSSCSGTTTTRKVFEYFGLQVVRNPENNNDWFSLKMNYYDMILDHLKDGNPIIFTTYKEGGGWYTDGGHIMSLLTANEEGLVYLYDTGTKEGKKNSWGHDVNTFVPLEDVINHCGKGCYFQMIKE